MRRFLNKVWEPKEVRDARWAEQAAAAEQAKEREAVEAKRKAEAELIEAHLAYTAACLNLSAAIEADETDELLAELIAARQPLMTRYLAARDALPDDASRIINECDGPTKDRTSSAPDARQAARTIFTILRRLTKLKPRLELLEDSIEEAEYDMPSPSLEFFQPLLDEQSQLKMIEHQLENELIQQTGRHAVAVIGLTSTDLADSATKPEGVYSVVASVGAVGVLDADSHAVLNDTVRCVALSYYASITPDEAKLLEKKIQHVGPQTVVTGIPLDAAVEAKENLELVGFSAKLLESRAPAVDTGLRQPIPESVRHEVWRRDEGRCVDCGSRERLEFDHIIPVIEGGSHTARNIELRCESCNRRKGARI